MRVRRPGTAQTTVGSRNDEEADHKVREHVGDRPRAQHEELGRERLWHVSRLEAIKLQRNNAAFTDGGSDALVETSSGAAQHVGIVESCSVTSP